MPISPIIDPWRMLLLSQSLIEPRLLRLFTSFFNLLFVFSLFFTVGILIYLGIIYITKSEDGAKRVHQSMPLLLIGLVLIFLSFTLPKIIEMFFK